jgi:5-oxoprolinase (ATP-hydrolysing)
VTGATRHVSLGPRKTSHFAAGDRIIISTPGGGGYGSELSEHGGKSQQSFADGLVVPPRERRAFLTNGSLGVRHSTATGN